MQYGEHAGFLRMERSAEIILISLRDILVKPLYAIHAIFLHGMMQMSHHAVTHNQGTHHFRNAQDELLGNVIQPPYLADQDTQYGHLREVSKGMVLSHTDHEIQQLAAVCQSEC